MRCRGWATLLLFLCVSVSHWSMFAAVKETCTITRGKDEEVRPALCIAVMYIHRFVHACTCTLHVPEKWSYRSTCACTCTLYIVVYINILIRLMYVHVLYIHVHTHTQD